MANYSSLHNTMLYILLLFVFFLFHAWGMPLDKHYTKRPYHWLWSVHGEPYQQGL